MTRTSRGLILATLSVSMLALAACSTTSSNPNMTNQADAARVDSILAREAKASGNKAETLTLLEKLYARNKDDAAIATSYGQALREDDQLNKARQVLTPFTKGKSPYPDAVTELAMVQLGLAQYKEAELTAKRALELDPQSGRAYMALGTALDAQNYHEPAEAAFRKGIDNWKGDPAPILNTLALNLASQNKLDQALAVLSKAKELSPGRVDIERNYRIISTLHEGANDFFTKQNTVKEQKKTAAPATEKKAEEKKPEDKKAAAEKSVKTSPAQTSKANKKETAPAPQKSQKTQNFNRSED